MNVPILVKEKSTGETIEIWSEKFNPELHEHLNQTTDVQETVPENQTAIPEALPEKPKRGRKKKESSANLEAQ